MNRVIYLVSDKIELGTLYNPSDLPAVRVPVNSETAEKANAVEGDILLLEQITGNVWRVIRRIKYPPSQDAYNWLLSDVGTGGGGEAEGVTIPIGSIAESYNFGFNPYGFIKASNWLLLAIISYIVYKELEG